MSDKPYQQVYEQALEIARNEFEEMFDILANQLASETESPVEELLSLAFSALLWETYGLYEWNQQVPIGKYRVDFTVAYIDPGMHSWPHPAIVAVECDGHDFHEKTKDQAKRDKSRDRNLLAKGITTVRFTGSEVWNDPFKCAQEVKDLASTLYYQRATGYVPESD